MTPRTPPDAACVTHHPPRPNRDWRLADPPHRICTSCYNQILALLSPTAHDERHRPVGIPALYTLLDPQLLHMEQQRRAPGFGSRSPARDHVIALRDGRSKAGPDRLRAAPAVLNEWCSYIAEQRRIRPPSETVSDQAAFLSRHLDWSARHEWIADLAAELRDLARQLNIAGGDPPPKPIATCIAQTDLGECGAALYMPDNHTPRAPDEPITTLPALTCPRCGADYHGSAIIRLRLANEATPA